MPSRKYAPKRDAVCRSAQCWALGGRGAAAFRAGGPELVATPPRRDELRGQGQRRPRPGLATARPPPSQRDVTSGARARAPMREIDKGEAPSHGLWKPDAVRRYLPAMRRFAAAPSPAPLAPAQAGGDARTGRQSRPGMAAKAERRLAKGTLGAPIEVAAQGGQGTSPSVCLGILCPLGG